MMFIVSRKRLEECKGDMKKKTLSPLFFFSTENRYFQHERRININVIHEP
jgi:hypothetical protein